VARENLARAFPDLDDKQIRRLAEDCYRHFGALLAEFARLPLLRPGNVPDLVDFEGLEYLDRALQAGRGGIVVSGHFGNWELMGAGASVLGYPVCYVVTGQENERVERLMDRQRERAGITIIKRNEALRGVIKVLRENRLVAILSDQDAHEAGAFVPFFGRPASTPRGAATFALRTGAALLFGESYRQGTGRLKVRFEPVPRDDLPADRDQAVWELTRRFTARLEEAVRRHPEQWFWMHRRWKTPPPENPP
jgi:KDO2-lipid IV(A) lauroyltransferase